MLLIKNCDIILKQKTISHYAQAGKMEAVEFFLIKIFTKELFAL
jgi:hypothetical protein